jgi:hypothetical protein
MALQAGVVYICTWGRGCELVHDVFDEEIVGAGEFAESVPMIVTTWHAEEPLSSAIWFLLRLASPHDAYA